MSASAVSTVDSRGATTLRQAEPDFGLYAIGGVAALRFQPIGSFGQWCNRIQLECVQTELGPEVGLGMRWRGVALDGTFGMRQLPTFMLVLTGTVGL